MDVSQIWEAIVRWAGTIEFFDFLDIAIVSYLIYKIIKLVRDTRAEQLVKGFILLAVGYFLVNILKLTTMKFLLHNVLTLGVTALVVVFQPELRRALEQVG
ncbi:MAG: TIGR00159 family protein, partial [Acetanaerobacterium sp.]